MGCQGVVQLGGPDPWYNQGGPAKVKARKFFLFTEGFLVIFWGLNCVKSQQLKLLAFYGSDVIT